MKKIFTLIFIFVTTFAAAQTTFTTNNLVVNGTLSGPGVTNFINPKNFGAKCDGSTNDATAFAAAFTYANSLPSATVVLQAGTGTCKLNSTLTLYPNKVGFDGGGNTLDFSALSSGFALTFSQSITDPNARPAANRAHPIVNLQLNGSGGSASLTAVDMSDHNPTAGPNYTIAGVSIQNSSFINFHNDVEIGNGAFGITFINDYFIITGGTGYGTSILIDNATNNGENLEFIACFFAKSAGIAITNNNPTSSLFARGTSFDYFQQVVLMTGGYVDLDGYIESNTDSTYWFDVSGTNSTLRVAGNMVVTNTTTKSSFEFFNIQSSATNGGLIFEAALVFSTGAYMPASRNMVNGTGRVQWRYLESSNNTAHPAIGGSSNNLWNPGFESTNIAEWTLTGTTPPARENSVVHSGSWALGFAGSSTNTPTAQKIIKCLPSQQLTGGIWWQAPVMTGTGGQAFIGVNYTDSSGTAILQGNTAASSAVNVSTWSYASLAQLTPAPQGTAQAIVTVDIFGTTSGAPTMYIDDVQMTCN